MLYQPVYYINEVHGPFSFTPISMPFGNPSPNVTCGIWDTNPPVTSWGSFEAVVAWRDITLTTREQVWMEIRARNTAIIYVDGNQVANVPFSRYSGDESTYPFCPNPSNPSQVSLGHMEPGRHRISIQMNSDALGRLSFVPPAISRRMRNSTSRVSPPRAASDSAVR